MQRLSASMNRRDCRAHSKSIHETTAWREKRGEAGIERAIHNSALEWQGLTNKQTSQVLGLRQWENNPPLEELKDAFGNTRIPIRRRVANRSATLAEYAAVRAENDNIEQAAWASRVSSKHKLSKSSSPELRRARRRIQKTARYLPGTSQSPDDDSSSYSDVEMQRALQQKGIPSLIMELPRPRKIQTSRETLILLLTQAV